MGFARSCLPVITLLGLAGVAAGQTTNGTISGHASDTTGGVMSGVKVTAASPNLQLPRTVVTSENGDYVIALLPPGNYTITFERANFRTVTGQATLAPTQLLSVDAEMEP